MRTVVPPKAPAAYPRLCGQTALVVVQGAQEAGDATHTSLPFRCVGWSCRALRAHGLVGGRAPAKHPDAGDAPAHGLLPAIAALGEVARPGEPAVTAAYPAVFRDVELG